MSEIATDFASDSGQSASTAPSEGFADSSSQEVTSEMGLGMLEASVDTDPEAGVEQTDGGAQAQTATDSGQQSNNEDLSEFEKGRREADRYFQQKNEQFLAERRQFDEERRAFQQQQSPQPQGEVEMGDAETLRQRAMQVNDPEQQRALMEQAAGIEYVDKMVEERLSSTLERMGLNNYQQDRQLFANMAQQQRATREAELTDQISDAKQAFGDDVLRDELTLQFITNNRGLLSTVNPDTGKNFTLTELVARWTGRPAQEAQEARENQRSQRNAAKVGASNRGNSAPVRDNTSGGPISREQAIAEISQTM